MSIKFTLQPVLDYRQRIVESLEMALARLLMKETEILDELSLLQALEKELFDELARRQQGLIDLTFVLQLRVQIKSVGKKIVACTETLREVRQQIAGVQIEIVNAQQAKETLEKLKAKEEAKWQLAQLAREAREQDDVYIARAHRLQEAENGK